MAQKKIIIDIDAEGNTTVTPQGFSGPACEEATSAIEEALGIVSERKRTPAFYAQEKARVEQQAGGA